MGRSAFASARRPERGGAHSQLGAANAACAGAAALFWPDRWRRLRRVLADRLAIGEPDEPDEPDERGCLGVFTVN